MFLNQLFFTAVINIWDNMGQPEIILYPFIPCETNKKVNIRNIPGILLCCKEKADKAWEN